MTDTELNALKKSVPMWLVAQSRLSLVRRGTEWEGLCPFHSEKNPSFQIYQETDGTWLGHCKACGAAANVFQLLQKTDNIDFAKAVQIVKNMTQNSEWKQKLESADKVFTSALSANSEIVSVPLENFQPFEQALANSETGQKWLISRGVSRETAERAHLGFVQAPHPSVVHTSDVAFDKGWILFPEIRAGRVVAVKYRSAIEKKFAQRKDMMKSPLYGQEQISFLDDLFVVEGECDQLIQMQAGFCTVSLPSAGFSPTPEMRTAMMKAPAIYLAGDMDTRGQAAMEKLRKELGGDDPKANVFRIEWPKPHKDANDVFLKLCNGDVEVFHDLVVQLADDAKTRKLPGISDMNTVLRTGNFESTVDSPRRLEFPWPNINKWVSILPGEVMFLFGTETKTGKSTWLMNILTHNTLKGKKVINFSAEQAPVRYAEMLAAHLTHSNRLLLTSEQRMAAARLLPPEHFYIGYKPGVKMSDVLKLLADAKQVYGGDIFVVDPLHFLIRGEQNENAAFANAMRQLVDFSIKWDVIVIAVGQARKSLAGNKNKMATGQDARFSAALSEDAASTWIIHRNRASKTNNPDEEPVFEPITTVKLEYARNAEPMSTKLVFDGQTASFLQYAGGQNE